MLKVIDMAKEVYHFHFRRPHYTAKLALTIIVATAGIMLVILGIFQYTTSTKYNLFLMFSESALPVIIVIGIIVYAIARHLGGTADESEFIIYDNGWFVFWRVDDQVWIAPAKIDWIYPEGMELASLHIKKDWNVYYISKKKKDGYYVVFRLTWAYPNKKWKNWVFQSIIRGLLSERESTKNFWR